MSRQRLGVYSCVLYDNIFAAMGHLYFDSVETFQATFGPHAPEILGDIPNYTNIQPMIQISGVVR